ncbi:exonuclease RNase T and DNA polymerase III [Rhodofomes roseus]|uniref:Exonuclease RNase T and DNA polymerase III n=1 Tax=Rhodofomes roseus TaxID=34475 RepID=A0ABQ8KIB7_9APHY|nr:exonuclease RNase T and DNA polymerase III [Rhodofomes roseus]KAH9837118.1 exonuclease RNase T and DNA polymerase III [Rhodofomes roseus]
MSASLRYLLILDLEATCGDDVEGVNEIIEFPTLVYDLQEDKVQSTFHEYVRPVVHPKLTDFCIDLTGITQDVVDAAEPFPAVWERYQKFLRDNELLADPASFAFLTCGNWDLRSMLPRQLDISESEHGLDASGNLVAPYNRFINVKDAFRAHYKLRYQQGMAQMLRRLKMELEGRHHSGIDDCRNILRIVQQMLADGWQPQGSLKP